MDPRSGLIAGFDAGQTHTTCRLAEAGSGRVLAEAQGPGVVHLASAQGPQRFEAALRQSLMAARCALPPTQQARVLMAAAVGASGIEADTPVQRQGLELAAHCLGLPPQHLLVTGDERTALAGAFGDGAGIVVISGTGTIALGRDAQGTQHRCGGWGWLLDGAGSAMDIGRDGLALSLRMADGRMPEGPLLRELWAGLGQSAQDPQAPQRIKAMVVEPGFGAAGFARLAPLVERLAAGGDRSALAILDANAAALAAMAAAVARRLELESPAVAGLGGAITHLATFRHRFQAALAGALPGAALVAPAGDATAGALALARQRLG